MKLWELNKKKLKGIVKCTVFNNSMSVIARLQLILQIKRPSGRLKIIKL